MNADKHRLDRVTEVVIGCAYEVGNKLGCGFLEKVYENAMRIELTKAGFDVQQQHPVNVLYDNEIVGEFSADILVENEIIVELKAVKAFDDIHLAQCLNYLKATGKKVCLLLNFGNPRVEIKRIVNDF